MADWGLGQNCLRHRDACSATRRHTGHDAATGTFTKDKPRLVAVMPETGHDEEKVLHLAASLERGSEHPLAKAIVRGTEERGVA